MTIDIISLLAVISAIAAVISAMCAYQASSTANRALKLQLNLETRKVEINLVSFLLKDLKTLSTIKQLDITSMPDDKFESIPQLIQDIKDKIEKLKSIGDTGLEEKILNWESKENSNSLSIMKILSQSSNLAFLDFLRDEQFLNERIDDLSIILQKLMA